MKARYEHKKTNSRSHISVTDYLNLANLPHWHTEHELIHMISGTAEVMVNNTIYSISEGMSIFVSNEEIHYIRSEIESHARIIKIDSELIKSVAGKHMLKSPIIENFYRIREISDEILSELSSGAMYCGIIADSIALRLAAEIFRSEETVQRTESGSGEKYKELLRLVSERYYDISFEEAAEFMCLSQPYFSRYFRKMSGMTFTQYLNIVKISAALEMLEERKRSVTDIAYACGFGTIRSFNRVFKELTGENPTTASGKSVIIRSERSDSGFDPTLSCSVKI